LWDFTKFTLPFLWKGGCLIKFQSTLTFVLMIVAKLLVVTYPVFIKYAIDGMTCDPLTSITICPDQSEIYMYIALYAGIKFTADFINYIREIPFSNVTASAECFIANMVYKHTQD